MRVALASRTVDAAARLLACLRARPALVLELLFWRAVLPVAKRTVPIARLAAMMWRPASTGVAANDPAQVQLVIDRGGRMLTSTNCVERSLVLYRMFSRAGLSPTLLLGTRHDGSHVAGHAWLEINGRAWGESDVAGYTKLVGFGERGMAIPMSRSDAA